jgi:hypothetical protein
MRARWLVVTLLLLGPGLANADEPSENAQANARFHAGLDAYQQEDYATASDEFEAAYKLDPVPALLWSWAQAERLGGHCARALGLYKKYLYADITKTQSEATRDMIARCERVEKARPKKAPPPAKEPVDAPRRWYKDPVAGGLTAGGALGIGVGIGFLVAAGHSEDRAHEQPFLDDFKSGLDEATSRRRIGLVSLGVGAALAATGIVLYMREKKAQDRAVVVSTDGHSVFVGARF